MVGTIPEYRGQFLDSSTHYQKLLFAAVSKSVPINVIKKLNNLKSTLLAQKQNVINLSLTEYKNRGTDLSPIQLARIDAYNEEDLFMTVLEGFYINDTLLSKIRYLYFVQF